MPLALSFCFYALSPSTKEVIVFFDSTGPKETRAYGPDDQMVWYNLPGRHAPLAFSLLGGLFVEMRKLDKLVLA